MRDESIVTIDGPAAAGKSSVAKVVAALLNYTYIDTGAMYRAITWKALKKNVCVEDEEAIVKLASDTNIKLGRNGEVFLDGRDISAEIRIPEIERSISPIAKNAGLRECLVRMQRKLGENGRIVVEGRDIGTVVFPKAKFKFYLDATLSERAKRRFKELREKGVKVKFEDVEAEIERRDKRDMTRETAPLCRAKDALYIDTTDLTISQVAEKILTEIRKKGGN